MYYPAESGGQGGVGDFRSTADRVQEGLQRGRRLLATNHRLQNGPCLYQTYPLAIGWTDGALTHPRVCTGSMSECVALNAIDDAGAIQ